MDTTIPVPTESHLIEGGRISISCFGRETDWRLASEDARRLIANFAFSHGVTEVMAPVPSEFNAVVCEPNQLSPEHEEPVGRCEKVTFFRKFKADGTQIKRTQAFYITSGDCPTLVVFNPITGELYAAHAGRNCLWDRGHIIDGKPAREHASVVDAIMEKIPEAYQRFCKAFIYLGIAAENFSHPVYDSTYGAANQKMIDHFVETLGPTVCPDQQEGKLAVKTIIREQLILWGIPADSIGQDMADTFGDKAEDGSLKWHSNRRGDKTRNGVLVIYHR